MILALLILLVGILWIAGATAAAKKVAVFTVALAITWSLVSFALCHLHCLVASGHAPAGGEVFWILAALAGLILVGPASWQGREKRRKRLEAFRKKNLHPRHRALPAAPGDEAYR